VEEIRARIAHEGTRTSVELTHALTTYADQLDRAGRIAEAVTAEVAAYWRRRSNSAPEFAKTVSLLSDRLLRSDRAEEARTIITKALPRLQRVPCDVAVEHRTSPARSRNRAPCSGYR
jgi:hypothetical protein